MMIKKIMTFDVVRPSMEVQVICFMTMSHDVPERRSRPFLKLVVKLCFPKYQIYLPEAAALVAAASFNFSLQSFTILSDLVISVTKSNKSSILAARSAS